MSCASSASGVPLALETLDLPSPSFLAVDRVRSTQQRGKPISLERSRLPWRPDFAPPFLKDGLVEGSLRRTLESLGHPAYWAAPRPSISSASLREDARELQQPEGEPFLGNDLGVVHDLTGSVVEHVRSLLHPARIYAATQLWGAARR